MVPTREESEGLVSGAISGGSRCQRQSSSGGGLIYGYYVNDTDQKGSTQGYRIKVRYVSDQRRNKATPTQAAYHPSPGIIDQ